MVEPYYASIIAAAPSATTMYVGCAPDIDPNDCGLAYGVNYTAFANTAFDAIGTVPEQLKATLHCDYDTKTGANCVYTATITQIPVPETGASTTSMSETGPFPVNTVTTNTTFAPSDVTYLAVTVTAGAENLKSGSVTASSVSSVSGSAGTKTTKTTGGTGTSSNGAVRTGQAAFALGVAGMLVAVL
jgi:hypothetical protein